METLKFSSSTFFASCVWQTSKIRHSRAKVRFDSLTLDFRCRPAIQASLFFSQFVDRYDQQDHYQNTAYPPNPHTSARPSIHPSVCMVHHKITFVVLRPAQPWKIQLVSGSSRFACFSLLFIALRKHGGPLFKLTLTRGIRYGVKPLS